MFFCFVLRYVQVAQNDKPKNLVTGFLIYLKYRHVAKSISLEHFVECKPFIFEE